MALLLSLHLHLSSLHHSTHPFDCHLAVAALQPVMRAAVRVGRKLFGRGKEKLRERRKREQSKKIGSVYRCLLNLFFLFYRFLTLSLSFTSGLDWFGFVFYSFHYWLPVASPLFPSRSLQLSSVYPLGLEGQSPHNQR